MKRCLPGLLFALLFPISIMAAPQSLRFYIGTYTGGESKGIYLASLDLESGKLREAKLAAETDNPSFLALSPSGKHLYAVNETGSGELSSFKIEPEDGKLTFLNQRPTKGGAPCHLVVDQTGKSVLVANYSGGSVASFPIVENGHLGPAKSFIQHQGASVNRRRQQAPHAHSINLDPANQRAFVADLGLDKVLVYDFDAGKGTLSKKPVHEAVVSPGSGPRHFAFHPSGKFAYVINELGNTVTAFTYDLESGELNTLQDISTLPKGFEGTSHTAEVVVSPNGKFLYGSNRGHDSIAVFKIDHDTGKLTWVEAEPTGGKTPRNFVVDPTGRYLLTENQNTHTIVSFEIDQASGALKPTGHRIDVPRPVCIRFLDHP